MAHSPTGSPSAQWLDRIIAGLAAFCALLIITGGTTAAIARHRIEFSSLDPWMLALSAIILLRKKLSSPINPTAGPLWQGLVDRSTEIFNDPRRSQRWATIAAVLVFTVTFIAHSAKHLSFNTHGLDMAYMQQPLFHAWSTPTSGAQTGLLKCDVCISGTYLGEHLALGLFALAPLTQWVFEPSVYRDYLVFALQSALILTVLLLTIYSSLSARARGSALFMALILLSERSLRGSAVWDFREDLLGFFSLTVGLIALKNRRYWAFGLMMIGAAFSKENFGLVLPFIAIPLGMDPSLKISRTRRLVLSALLVALSTAWIWIAFKHLLPAFNPYAPHSQQIANRLSRLGSTPSDVLIHVLTDPVGWWQLLLAPLFRPTGLKYLLLLLGPVIWIARRSPYWLVPAVPGILMNVVGISNQLTQQFHYELIILPFLFMAVVQGCEDLSLADIPSHKKASTLALAVWIALCFSGRWPASAVTGFWPQLSEVSDSHYLSQISGPATTAMDWRLIAHLTQLENLRVANIPAGLPVIETNRSPMPSQVAIHKFDESNPRDVSQIPGRSVRQARRWILDLDDPWQARLETELLTSGWAKNSVSPSGRYAELTLPNN